MGKIRGKTRLLGQKAKLKILKIISENRKSLFIKGRGKNEKIAEAWDRVINEIKKDQDLVYVLERGTSSGVTEPNYLRNTFWQNERRRVEQYIWRLRNLGVNDREDIYKHLDELDEVVLEILGWDYFKIPEKNQPPAPDPPIMARDLNARDSDIQPDARNQGLSAHEKREMHELKKKKIILEIQNLELQLKNSKEMHELMKKKLEYDLKICEIQYHWEKV